MLRCQCPEVAGEASGALSAKRSHLAEDSASGAEPDGAAEPAASSAPAGAECSRFTVSVPHGLHARPSALVVQALRGLDAEVRLRNLTLDTPAVSAASLSRVATLGALQGHEVEIRATGAQAPAAVQALLDLARDDFGESAGAAAGPAVAAPASSATQPSGRPVPAAPGIGIGPACVLASSTVEGPTPQPGAPHAQRDRLEQAVTTVRSHLTRIRERTAGDIGEAEATIFDAQLLLLDDPDLGESVDELIDSGTDAARAWAEAIEDVERQFADGADAYLRARAADVRDLRDQVLRVLGGTVPAGTQVEGVVVTDDLTPAQATELDPARTAGVLLGPVAVRPRTVPSCCDRAGFQPWSGPTRWSSKPGTGC